MSAVEICEVASTEEDEPSTFSMLDMLRPHILVNSIGDYYDVPGLKQQANKTISDILEHSWYASDIAATVELSVASTSDTELCTIMATAVADHMTELIDREDFTQHKLFNQFSLGVVRELFKKLKASERKVELGEEDLQSCKWEVSQLEEKVSRMERAIETHGNVLCCRHCGISWTGYIEPGSYLVRCSECRTRHYG